MVAISASVSDGSSLNLVMPIAAGALPSLVAALQPAPGGADPLHTALTRLGNVHFAQFLFLENNTRLGVFTIFDGDFNDYIVSFVEHIGDIFNAILAHIDGAAGLIPVQEHRDDLREERAAILELGVQVQPRVGDD